MNAPRDARMGRSVVLMGGGGHAAVVADAARLSGWNVLGFVSDHGPDEHQRAQQDRAGLAWLGTIDALADVLKNAPPDTDVFPAVGDSELRRAWMQRAASAGVAVAIIVHPTAVIAESASLEPGVFVAPQAVIGPRANVMASAIINTAAVVEHDCEIGACAHIAPGCILTGSVHVGDAAMVGARAVIIPERIIGAGAFIAAGAVVTQNVEPSARVAGCPAVPIKRSEKHAAAAVCSE